MTLEWEAAGGYGCSYVWVYLIFRNAAVEGLQAAFYSVLELSIPLRQLGNDLYGPGAALRGGTRLLRRTTFPAMKLCLEGLCSCNCLIVKLPLSPLGTRLYASAVRRVSG